MVLECLIVTGDPTLLGHFQASLDAHGIKMCTVPNKKVTEFVPGKKVVWHVLDSELSFAKDKSEWNDTDIVVDISEKDGKTEVRFTHEGLVPRFECYGSGSNAWGTLINESRAIPSLLRATPSATSEH
jgi:hypothetical protein